VLFQCLQQDRAKRVLLVDRRSWRQRAEPEDFWRSLRDRRRGAGNRRAREKGNKIPSSHTGIPVAFRGIAHGRPPRLMVALRDSSARLQVTSPSRDLFPGSQKSEDLGAHPEILRQIDMPWMVRWVRTRPRAVSALPDRPTQRV